MNVNEFVNKVFLRYPPDIKGDDTEEDLMLDYIKALSTGKEYDFENAFIDLMRSFRFKYLPTAKILLETLEQNEIKPGKNKTSYYISNVNVWSQYGNSEEWFPTGIAPGQNPGDVVSTLIKKGHRNVHVLEYGKNPNYSEVKNVVCSL